MNDNVIKHNFQLILENYVQTIKTETNTNQSKIFPLFSGLTEALNASKLLAQDKNLTVSWSCGKGGWAYVPWIAVFHQQETRSTQKGVYVIYLFRQDMQGFYLTLNQGVTTGLDHKVTGEERYHRLHKTAKKIRSQSTELIKSGFKLDNSIDLKATTALGKSYVQSTIAHKYYEANDIPDDAVLLKDLDDILSFYLKYVTKR